MTIDCSEIYSKISRKNEMKKLRWILICICLAFTAGCTQAQSENKFDGVVAVKYYRNSPEDIVTLNIPKGHIDLLVHGGLPHRPIESDLYFIAEMPSFMPRSIENNLAFEYPNHLIQQARFSMKSLNQIPVAERHERMQRVLMIPFGFGMTSRPCTRNSQPTERFGLQRYAVDLTSCPKNGPNRGDDILVERTADAGIKTIIECTPDDVPDTTEQIRTGRHAGYSPHCKQAYVLTDLNAQITVSYAREFNKDWRLIQQRVNTLLVSFIQTSK